MGIGVGSGASWDDDEDIRDNDGGSMFGGGDRFEKRKQAKELLKERGAEDFDLEDIDRVVLEELSIDSGDE